MQNVPPPHVVLLPDIPVGWHAQRYKVLKCGRLAIVSADADFVAAYRSDVEHKTVGARSELDATATGKIWTVSDDALVEELTFPLLSSFPAVEQFSDGRWLVEDSRRGVARIVNSDGGERKPVEIGRYVAHIQIDDRDRIWVGWFDQGVYGNDAWRTPGYKQPISSFGIAAFSDAGEVLRHAQLTSLADCYALNVVGDDAWSCTYTDFPIMKMSDDQERTWETNLRGASALAVDYPFVLAAGGYGPDSNRVVLLRLEHHGTKELGEWRLPFAERSPWELSLLDGRGDQLHVVRDGQWLRWRVRDFMKLASAS